MFDARNLRSACSKRACQQDDLNVTPFISILRARVFNTAVNSLPHRDIA